MYETLEARLGHSFINNSYLEMALTHRSFYFENRSKSAGHYERLEFLGDVVLDLALSEALMSAYPEAEEGTLSKWRASLVNSNTLSEIARELELGSYLKLGRSELSQGGQERPRLLASAMEAVIAAVYLDGGLEKVKILVEARFGERVAELDQENQFAADSKTRLQEWSQKLYRCVPEYKMIGAEGPEHAKTFTFEVFVEDRKLGTGSGSSRKAAEQAAARNALEEIKE